MRNTRLPQFESSRPKELPLEALTEPDVNVSAHPALVFGITFCQWANSPRLLTHNTLQPVDCQPLVVPQSFTLTHGPSYSPLEGCRPSDPAGEEDASRSDESSRNPSGWFVASACTAAPRGPPSSLFQFGFSADFVPRFAFVAHNPGFILEWVYPVHYCYILKLGLNHKRPIYCVHYGQKTCTIRLGHQVSLT